MYGISIKAYWANTVRSTVLLLLVVFEEISHFIHGVFKVLKLRKINYPEMVRLFPVEALPAIFTEPSPSGVLS